MSNGRFYVRTASGRTFCVEPVEGRVDESKDWKVGGAPQADGGAIRECDSIITPENGFTNIVTLPPGTSPLGYIDSLDPPK